MVYGIENKDGFFYNFVLETWTVWSHECQLPALQLAENIYLLYSDNNDFSRAKVIPVKAE
ncbi:hypothetical protein ABE82_26540 (plasmid) [Paenibacillus peoriae]|uniref:hypothetical protein n=1 Tax=Paenibacillus peoriae TaxID=59893 RepID=UPI000722861C|nr:hypothetical protein [Paenibacillus peoriae]ALS09973.1 hypothetical protein ABE82_26540 [Paenibacillus peoriae]